MRLTIVGTGYVGLVTGTCLAESGNDVTCVDIDVAKIDSLRVGRMPIYEPGLEELIEHNLRDGRLSFSTKLAEAISDCRLIFVAVGTPQKKDGSADLTFVESVLDDIRRCAKDEKVVVIKSTVPVGTNRRALVRLNDGAAVRHKVASNPEFLKQGAAVDDFMRPDRVVVGLRDDDVRELLSELYAPFLRAGQPFLVMSPESAELTKYVANALLASKISFINEMANLCEKADADVNDVRQGIGHDERIGFQFLHPGVGYGGSCFPKDVRELQATFLRFELYSQMLAAVDAVNEAQKQLLFAKLRELLADHLAGATVALWGLAFKPRTDDIREAPAITLIHSLLGSGANVRVHDPEAMPNALRVFGERIAYCDRPYKALESADALAIVTEWQEFRHPDWQHMRKLMKQPNIVDGRNLYDPDRMAKEGFNYASIGRRTVRGAR